MTNHNNVMALLAEANPIPDPAALERREAFNPAGLVDVSPATQLELRPGGVRWALVSAVVAVVLAISVFVATRSTTVDPVETIPGPTLPTTPAPTSEPPASEPATEPESLEGAWDAFSYSLVLIDGRYAITTTDLAVDGGTYIYEDDELALVSDDSSASCAVGSEARFTVDLSAAELGLEPLDDDCGLDRGLGVGSKSLQRGEATDLPPSALDVARPLSQLSGPGLYESQRFSPGFSVVLPRGWDFHAGPLSPDVDYSTSVNDSQTLIVWYRHQVESPDDVHDLFASHPVVEVGEPRPTMLAGVEGITFDYMSPGPNNLLNAPGMGAGSIVGPPENVWRTWALDVDGVVVTIVVSFDPDTLPEKAVEVEQILNSIIWDG
ncbi:MAG: hypothetical protein HKN94_12660 [Acidimicrobiales bacterium]|nr:hypothetical protein [Acidimicrobiales bacterium]RZV48773.1 MAG: hypothetical protein EX269_00325 [Acidimicrobiales bacterium]